MENKKTFVKARVTEKEKEFIQAKADKFCNGNMSKFILQSVSNATLISNSNVIDNEAMFELKKIGNNFNQITTTINRMAKMKQTQEQVLHLDNAIKTNVKLLHNIINSMYSKINFNFYNYIDSIETKENISKITFKNSDIANELQTKFEEYDSKNNS